MVVSRYLLSVTEVIPVSYDCGSEIIWSSRLVLACTVSNITAFFFLFFSFLFIPDWDIDPQATSTKPAYPFAPLAVHSMSFTCSLYLSLNSLLRVFLSLRIYVFP